MVVNEYNHNTLINNFKEVFKMSSVMVGRKMESIFDGHETIYSKAEANDKNDKQLLHIVNNTPIKEDYTVKKSLTTTTKLSMQINEVFGPLFTDWYGSEVIPDSNGNLMVNFVFRAIAVPQNEELKKKMAFLPLSKMQEKTSNRTLDRIMSINMINSTNNQTMGLTQYGAEMAYDVMLNGNRNKVNPNNPESFRKQNLIGEIAENVGFGGMQQNIYCVISGIDIYKVLNVVFGTNDENGDRVIRNAVPIRPVTAFNTGRNNFIMEIETMSTKKYNETMVEIGASPMPGAITAITGTLGDMRR